MSNQRPGKWKSATLRDGSGMQTVTFFKIAKNLLEEYGHEDAAFYFEQVEEHLRSGGGLPNDSKEVGKVLGVMTKYYRIMRFRNSRVAKFFADFHGGIYKGWVEGKTTYQITRGETPYLEMTRGAIS